MEFSENLDCYSLDPEDLRQFAHNLESEGAIGKKSKKLLIAYALNLAQSMTHRYKGELMQAGYLDAKNQDIYNQLPKKYRW